MFFFFVFFKLEVNFTAHVLLMTKGTRGGGEGNGLLYDKFFFLCSNSCIVSIESTKTIIFCIFFVAIYIYMF